MRRFGRLLQLLGLVLLPLGMILNFMQAPGGGGPLLSLGQMLVVMVGGFCAFYIGRIVEGYAVNKK
jgi:hypothetical protein